MEFVNNIAEQAKDAGEQIVEEVQKIVGGSTGRGLNPETIHDDIKNEIKADVRMFSGCKDAQTSADVHDVSKFGLPDAEGAGGACTNAVLLNLADDKSDTWLSLLRGMRQTLASKKFKQVPQLSTSREMDIKSPFSLVGPGDGNKKSLLIGINYVGQQPGELKGCHNDVAQIKDFIAGQGFSVEEGPECRIIMDDGEHMEPTRKNITDSFVWFTEGVSAGDSLFMHYSGHGGSVADKTGDEEDMKDETMIPADYQEAGQIKDDEIFAKLVKKLPEGVTLTVIMDCCHSGSILDLPYKINGDALEAVEAGEAPPITSLNNFFNFTKLQQAGMDILGGMMG